MRSHGMTDLIYVAYMSCPTGSIVAPFLLGAIADRFFPVQKVLGTMHLLSSACLAVAPFLAERVGSPVLFNIALFAHMLCYMPTVGLATATAFHLLQNKEREFPRVRMLGTIGWVRRHQRWVTALGGLMLIMVGLLLVTGWWDVAVDWMRTWFFPGYTAGV